MRIANEMLVEKVMVRLSLDYGPALEATLKLVRNIKDFELELAKLKVRLADLAKTASQGILAPDVSFLTSLVRISRRGVA